LKEVYDFDNPKKRFKGRVPDETELEARFVLYNPVIWKNKDNFVAEFWKSGVMYVFPTFSGTERGDNIVVCFLDGHMRGYSGECDNDKNWYANKVQTHKIILPHNAMHTARNIAGDIYFAGTPRKLFKRIGPDQWIDLTDEAAHPNLFQDIDAAKQKQGNLRGLPLGFHAIDGFSGNDLYAGGRHADLWHWLDGRWHRMDPPTNASISAIACGADGRVYIGCEQGMIYAGGHDSEQGEQWQKPEMEEEPVGITSMTWFDGRLWIGAKHGLFTCDDNSINRYTFPDKRHSVAGDIHLSACNEALLAYNDHSAVVFDKQGWTTIVRTEIPVEVPGIDQIDPDFT
jgi:hypothetical protein